MRTGPRLRLMTGIDEDLATAHALIAQAGAQVGGRGFEAAASRSQCREIAFLLEELGALPSAELLLRTEPGTSRDLLLRAAEVLDGIPAHERPPRLTVARVELAAAIVDLSGEG